MYCICICALSSTFRNWFYVTHYLSWHLKAIVIKSFPIVLLQFPKSISFFFFPGKWIECIIVKISFPLASRKRNDNGSLEMSDNRYLKILERIRFDFYKVDIIFTLFPVSSRKIGFPLDLNVLDSESGCWFGGRSCHVGSIYFCLS